MNRQPCTTCQTIAERFPGRTVELGRLREDGQWRCDRHNGAVNPTPDPASTAVGFAQAGWVRSLQDAARAAMRYHVDPIVLREALEAAIRGAHLDTVEPV